MNGLPHLPMNTFGAYTAWLNGNSVARGSLADVERKAREIANSPLWLEWNQHTVMKITRGPKQLFVKAINLR